MGSLNNTNTTAEIGRFEQYIELDPDNSLLWINLADLYSQANNQDKATACYEQCLHIDPGNPIARSRLASQWISQGRYQEAEEALRQLQTEIPHDPALQHNLGVVLFAQQRWQEAVTAFKSAQASGLDSTSNLLYIVRSLHHSGELTEAREAAQIWLKKAPGPDAEGYVALLEMDQGDMTSARKRAERVHRNAPDNVEAATVLGNFYLEQHQIETAERYFGNILASEPNNPRGWLGIGLTHLYRQHNNEAIESFERVLEYSPNHPGAQVTLGWAKLVNLDTQGAEAAFRQSIATNTDFGEAYGGLACALFFQQRNDEAYQAIKRAQALDDASYSAVFAKSLLLASQRDKRQGTKMLAELLQHTPQEGTGSLIDHIRVFLQQATPSESAPKPPQKE